MLLELENAVSVSLIVDLWTNISSSNFIALAVSITNNSFEREIFALQMKKLNSRADAEYIKTVIETMVNHFNFNKCKISNIVCDQGSNLTKLFLQPENLIVEENSQEQDDFESEIIRESNLELRDYLKDVEEELEISKIQSLELQKNTIINRDLVEALEESLNLNDNSLSTPPVFEFDQSNFFH